MIPGESSSPRAAQRPPSQGRQAQKAWNLIPTGSAFTRKQEGGRVGGRKGEERGQGEGEGGREGGVPCPPVASEDLPEWH